MRVLWTHNFNPDVPTSGVFMHTTARGLREYGIDLTLEYVGNLRSLFQIRRARKHIKTIARDFDIVHSQYGSACSVVTSAVQGIPKIMTIRGSDWQIHRSSVNFLTVHTRLASMMTKTCLRRYDCITPVSRKIAEEVSSIAPKARVVVLPSPIDTSRFVPQNKREARDRLGYPNNTEKWVLFNSRNLNNPVKRFALAKRAFEIAQARRGDLRLRLATDLSYEAMPLFVASCDLIVCTSDNEGWPNSIKEALACNVPFVTTDVGDLQDIASIESSCRVCPADAELIADNICQVLDQEGPQNLSRHVRDMRLESVSERLVSIYEDLVVA